MAKIAKKIQLLAMHWQIPDTHDNGTKAGELFQNLDVVYFPSSPSQKHSASTIKLLVALENQQNTSSRCLQVHAQQYYWPYCWDKMTGKIWLYFRGHSLFDSILHPRCINIPWRSVPTKILECQRVPKKSAVLVCLIMEKLKMN